MVILDFAASGFGCCLSALHAFGSCTEEMSKNKAELRDTLQRDEKRNRPEFLYYGCGTCCPPVLIIWSQ